MTRVGVLLDSIRFHWVLWVSTGAVQEVWVKTLHRDVAGKKKVLGDTRGFHYAGYHVTGLSI